MKADGAMMTRRHHDGECLRRPAISLGRRAATKAALTTEVQHRAVRHRYGGVGAIDSGTASPRQFGGPDYGPHKTENAGRFALVSDAVPTRDRSREIETYCRRIRGLKWENDRAPGSRFATSLSGHSASGHTRTCISSTGAGLGRTLGAPSANESLEDLLGRSHVDAELQTQRSRSQTGADATC